MRDELAGRNHARHLRSRSLPRRAAATLRTAANGGRIETFVVDLASVAHVRELAEAIAGRTDRLDVLIHDAGLTTDRQIETEDGFELTFAVNVLAPFVLTTELLPLLSCGGG